MLKKRFTLELQKHPLKNLSVTTRDASNTQNTEIAMSYQSIYGNSNMLIYHQLLNSIRFCFWFVELLDVL